MTSIFTMNSLAISTAEHVSRGRWKELRCLRTEKKCSDRVFRECGKVS